MTRNLHPSADDLSALMLGDLDEERSEELLAHVEGCDACLEATEAHWQGGARERLSLAAREPEDLSTLECQLLRRLHAVDLGEQATQLVSSGFAFVVVRLIAPVLYFISGRPAARRHP